MEMLGFSLSRFLSLEELTYGLKEENKEIKLLLKFITCKGV